MDTLSGQSDRVQQLNQPIYSCRRVSDWRFKFTSQLKHYICAGDYNFPKEGKSVPGSCLGDSDSPLVCPVKDAPGEWLQFGVTSSILGKEKVKDSAGERLLKCGRSNSLYVRVQDYLDWIVHKIETE